MKKIISLLLALCMIMSFAGITAGAFDSDRFFTTADNSDSDAYINIGRWNDTTKSFLVTVDSGFMLFEYYPYENSMVATYYDDAFTYLGYEVIEAELPVFGGFYASESNYYVLTGQYNYECDESVECYRLTKYDTDWNRIGAAGLYACNTTEPFEPGCPAFAECGKYLVVHTSHQMYNGHQSNLTFQVDTQTMAVTDCRSDVSNISTGYVSHSMNQLVQIENNSIVTVDHGDAYPRSVVLTKYNNNITDGGFYSWDCSSCSCLDIYGATGNNDTGCTASGFEISDTAYIVSGTSVVQDEENYSNSTHNVYISSVSKADGSVSFRWITEYEEGEESPSLPHLVKVSANFYCLLWDSSDGISYVYLDGNGNVTGDIITFDGQLSDCKPVVSGNEIIWYVRNYNSYNTSTFVDLYVLDTSTDAISLYEDTTFSQSNGDDENNTTEDFVALCNVTKIENFSIEYNFSTTLELTCGETYYYYIHSDKDLEYKLEASDTDVLSVTPVLLGCFYVYEVVALKPGECEVYVTNQNGGTELGYAFSCRESTAEIPDPDENTPCEEHDMSINTIDGNNITAVCENCGFAQSFTVPQNYYIYEMTENSDGDIYLENVKSSYQTGESIKVYITYDDADTTAYEFYSDNEDIMTVEPDYENDNVYTLTFHQNGDVRFIVSSVYNSGCCGYCDITVEDAFVCTEHDYTVSVIDGNTVYLECVYCGDTIYGSYSQNFDISAVTEFDENSCTYSFFSGNYKKGEAEHIIIHPENADFMDFEITVSDPDIFTITDINHPYYDIYEVLFLEEGTVTVTFTSAYNPEYSYTYTFNSRYATDDPDDPWSGDDFENTQIEEKTAGDVDGDGSVTASDARLALRIAANISTGSTLVMLSADADGNGKVSAMDARTILRVAAKLDDESVLAKFMYDGNDEPDAGDIGGNFNEELSLVTLGIGETFDFGSRIILGSGVKWESSNPSVAAVDSRGNIKGIAKGYSCIIATVGSKKYYYDVNVKTEMQLEIDELRNKYPEGYYWNNHTPSLKYPDVTETPCSDHPTYTYAYCKGQCAGFAALLFNEIHGSKTSVNYGVTWDTVKIGDYIRLYPHHSVFVTDVVEEGDIIGYDRYSGEHYYADSKYIVVVHCNWGCNCDINWDDIFYPSRYSFIPEYSYTPG